MATNSSDQPEGVTTQEVPRPRDENVVTSDSPAPVVEGANRPPANAEPNPDAGDDLGDDQEESTADSTGEGMKEPRRRRRNRGAQRETARQLEELRQQTARILADQEASKSEIARLKAELEQANNAARPPPKKPRASDFINREEEFAAAWKEYETAMEKRSTATRTPAPPDDRPTRASTERPVPESDLHDFHAAGVATYGFDGWEEIKAAGDTIAKLVDVEMARVIASAGVDGAVIYAHLTEHPKVAAKIHAMKTADKAEALADLRRQAKAGTLDDGSIQSEPLYDAKERGTQPAATSGGTPRGEGGKFVTKAPAPPSSTPRTTGPVTDNLEAMPMDDYAAKRSKENAARHGIYK